LMDSEIKIRIYVFHLLETSFHLPRLLQVLQDLLQALTGHGEGRFCGKVCHLTFVKTFAGKNCMGLRGIERASSFPCIMDSHSYVVDAAS
jgi:hypothetical protein